ncbi:hypothetical protein MKW94_004323 [Papaver nudicaule]|uniref:Response regulatory domain-containing protein n=1 Tax=Papaver nudicaule TaxID=74823 RepID=A0AA41RU07_PAPNU|nr:hypothetical protein [Papaver nudicaule]
MSNSGYVDEFSACSLRDKALPAMEESITNGRNSVSIDSMISLMKKEEGYPVGLKVLVVDEDLSFLQEFDSMLQQCNYKGTRCSSASQALSMLHDESRKFDIILMAVAILDNDKDGFKQVERDATEADLPISYLQCLWFPVAENRKQKLQKLVEAGFIDAWDRSVISTLLYSRWGDDGSLRKLIKVTQEIEEEEENYMDGRHEDHYTSLILNRKTKIPWMASGLDVQFVSAVYKLGGPKKAEDPAKILELMKSPAGLTRKDVAIHLKEFRFLRENFKDGYPSNMPFNEEVKPLCSSSMGFFDDADFLRTCGGFYA